MDNNNTNTNGMANPNNNIVRNWLIGIGIALVIIIAITYAIHRKDTISPVIGGDMSTTTGETTATTPTGSAASTSSGQTASAQTGMTTPATGEMITVNNQSAGGSVAIESMALTEKSWVAVKDAQGVILGAGLFQANDTAGIIPLIKGTTPGETYMVVIYIDTTDKTFDYHKDPLVVSADNAPVSATFVAQ